MKIRDFPRTGTGASVGGHTAGMALRFAVQADTEAECAAGLRMLQSLGLQTAMTPKLLTDNRWMARAVPVMKAPAEDRGPDSSG